VKETKRQRIKNANSVAARAAELFYALLLGYEITLPAKYPGESDAHFCFDVVEHWHYAHTTHTIELCRVHHRTKKDVHYVVEPKDVLHALVKLCRDFQAYNAQEVLPSEFIKSNKASPIWLDENGFEKC
jgi:hypothetical protein